jgi:hypothetical protein
MKISRRQLISAGIVVGLAGGIWTYRRLTHDGRFVDIDIRFAGANSEFAVSGATLPLNKAYDIGLGYFDISLTGQADGLKVILGRSAHALSWPGDLVFYTLATEIIVPINGSEEATAIYDTSKPAADGAEGPLFVGNLYLTSRYQEFL